MFIRIVLLFFFAASVYFASGIIEGWSKKEEHKIKAMKDLYDSQQEIEERIKEIESRRDELETTMVKYMREVDRRMKIK